MRPILGQAERHVLRDFASGRALVAFDFDGTLAPIVRKPDGAQMRPGTRERLLEVARRFPCAVLTGRSRADVATRLAGIPLVEIIGNHGLEPYGRAAAATRTAARWTAQLEASLGGLAGVEIENKGPSLAIHYRRAPVHEHALRKVNRAIRALVGAFRIIPGKCVVNVVPHGAPNKGTALRRLRATLRGAPALYVGDDVTDEDVFELGEPWLLSVRVGREPSSAAAYYLRAQADVDRLLERLLSHREALPVAGRPRTPARPRATSNAPRA